MGINDLDPNKLLPNNPSLHLFSKLMSQGIDANEALSIVESAEKVVEMVIRRMK